MRLQMIKTGTGYIRENLASSVFSRAHSIQFKNLPSEYLSTLLQHLHIFKQQDKSSSPAIIVGSTIEKKEHDTLTLQHLENCANAARKTEAYGHYQWTNKADE